MGTQAHRVAGRRQSQTTGRLRRPRGTSSSWYKNAIIYELHVRTFFDSDGDGAILLNVRATDPAGNVATASRVVPFDGSMVIIDDGYQVRLAECIGSWIGVVNRKILQRERVPPWVPVNLPELPVLADFVRAVMRVGSPEADQYLALITLAHGPTLTRALGRPAPLRSERGHADQH
jgi:hypothetical protein